MQTQPDKKVSSFGLDLKQWLSPSAGESTNQLDEWIIEITQNVSF